MSERVSSHQLSQTLCRLQKPIIKIFPRDDDECEAEWEAMIFLSLFSLFHAKNGWEKKISLAGKIDFQG